jgi:hypothetical protein
MKLQFSKGAYPFAPLLISTPHIFLCIAFIFGIYKKAQRGAWTSCSWELAEINEEEEVIDNFTGREKVKREGSEMKVRRCHIDE